MKKTIVKEINALINDLSFDEKLHVLTSALIIACGNEADKAPSAKLNSRYEAFLKIAHMSVTSSIEGVFQANGLIEELNEMNK